MMQHNHQHSSSAPAHPSALADAEAAHPGMLLPDQLLPDQLIPDWVGPWGKFLCQIFGIDPAAQPVVQAILDQLAIGMEAGDSALQLDRQQFLEQLKPLCQQYVGHGLADHPLVWDAPLLYLQRYWAMEYRLAQRVALLRQQAPTALDVSRYQAQLFGHNLRQQEALALGVNQRFAIITGGPGTGKTFVLSRIVAVLRHAQPDLRVGMAAPTGKAAQRMLQALQQAFAGEALHQAGLYQDDFDQLAPQTVHRLLGLGYQTEPRYHADHPLPYDVIVIDEASMLDLRLAQLLLDAIGPDTRLILLGDSHQLSSVDVGQVLADLVAAPSLHAHLVQLEQSQRFAADAQIGQFARLIYDSSHDLLDDDALLAHWQDTVRPEHLSAKARQHLQVVFQGETPFSADQQAIAQVDRVNWLALPLRIQPEQLQALYDQLAAGYADYVTAVQQLSADPRELPALMQVFDRYRILVAQRAGALGLYQINRAISERIRSQVGRSASGDWFVGRTVMITVNDPQLGLANGDIGLCVQTAGNTAGGFEVYFDSLGACIAASRLPQSVETAFALTIHKSQGSEFRHTAVILDQQAQRLHSRELLYTAITRAKRMISLYAHDEALIRSLRQQSTRHSGLTRQIERAIKQTSPQPDT